MTPADVDALLPLGTALLTPAEVAKLFGVDAKTIARWAKAGQLESIRTPGGSRRYPVTVIRALLLRGGR